MGRGKWAPVTLGLLTCTALTVAFLLNQQAKITSTQVEWLLGIWAAALIPCAALVFQAVMGRPRGARLRWAVFVVVELALAVCIWLAACFVLTCRLLLAG